jgi:hypothetical protein
MGLSSNPLCNHFGVFWWTLNFCRMSHLTAPCPISVPLFCPLLHLFNQLLSTLLNTIPTISQTPGDIQGHLQRDRGILSYIGSKGVGCWSCQVGVTQVCLCNTPPGVATATSK